MNQMNQTELLIAHDHAMDQIEMYISGLLTLLELQREIARLGLTYDKVFDLIDPASGLRYK